MKKKDGMTGWLMKCSSSCLIFMGCSLIFMGFSLLLTGCTEKARKMEKKNIKVETISVGNTNLGGTKDYVGTIEEKMGSTLSFEIAGNITSIRVDEGDRVSKGQLLATINPTTVKEAHRATLTPPPETGAGCLQKIPAPPSVGNHLGYEMGGDRKQTGTGKGG